MTVERLLKGSIMPEKPMADKFILQVRLRRSQQATVYNFTYKNYVEILSTEYDENGDWNGQGGYIDTYKNDYNGRIYGLLPENVTETFDGGSAYGNPATRDQKVK